MALTWHKTGSMIIKELTLYANNLALLTDFYGTLLGFKVLEKTGNSTSFHIGHSKLTFVKKQGATPYHFAFNIPSNKVQEALSWLKKHVEILPSGGKEIIDFKNWNAQAIYFYDPDQNICELIARHNLEIKTEGSFGASQILSISEIGLPCMDIEAVYRFFYQLFPISLYDGNFDRFCAMGDEDGLFIVIDKRTKPEWFPTFDTAFSSDFKALIEYNDKSWEIIFEKEKLTYLK